MDRRIEKVIVYMREEYHRELSLSALARHVNLSLWRLSHLFKIETGSSPVHYLKDIRMRQAKYLLEASFLSVKEITGRIGLKDESHFVRDFKRTYGLSPTQYRAQAARRPGE